MIPRETVDKILDATQIVDVVSDFVTLKKRGANYSACCPFHNEKTPSFYVSPSKGIYKCFGCGKAGSAVGFVMEHESLSYSEALKYLARKYHIEVVEKEETAEEIAARQKNESLMLVTEFAQKFFVEQLGTPEGKSVGEAYFKYRGLEAETVEKFGLGWAPGGRDSLSKKAREAGYKEDFLVETGLSIKRDNGSLVDRFYERVMFPIHSVGGRVIAFGGRTLKTDKTVAKYVNSPESEIYKKSYSLYGIYFAKNEIVRQSKCLLVEGYLDVISMHQLGITNVVASSGTSLTVEQVKLIKKFTENVTIIYDGDSAGIHAALRGIDLVLKEGLNVKVVLLPDGDDPDSFSRKHTLEEVQEFISGHERDFIGFKSDLLLEDAGGDPLKKAELINNVADSIALIPDPVKRSVYVESCSGKFNIESSILFERISRTREKLMVDERKRWQREESVRQIENVAPVAQQEVAKEDGIALEDRFLAPCEKELLDFVLNNGQDLLEFDSDSPLYSEEPCNVADFIDSCLGEDNEDFVNEIYRKIYELYFEYYEEGLSQEQITSRLMGDADEAVVKVTEDLVIPKYDLSIERYRSSLTAEKTRLARYVPVTVLTYKKNRITERKRKCREELAGLAGPDADREIEIMQEIKNLNDMEKLIDERLGRRPARR